MIAQPNILKKKKNETASFQSSVTNQNLAISCILVSRWQPQQLKFVKVIVCFVIDITGAFISTKKANLNAKLQCCCCFLRVIKPQLIFGARSAQPHIFTSSHQFPIHFFNNRSAIAMFFKALVNRIQLCPKICAKENTIFNAFQNFSTASAIPSIEVAGFRLNRCFPLLSRRDADKVISSGRVTVNGTKAQNGLRLVPNDIVRLDGKVIDWNSHKENTLQPLSLGINNALNIYIKMWKPKNSTCTTDLRDSSNIFAATNILSKVTKHRLFPVGRLDKHTTGLLLLTSDTRLVDNLLGASSGQEKVYEVRLHKNISDEHIQILSEGVEITTATTQGKVITALTLPCVIKRIASRLVLVTVLYYDDVVTSKLLLLSGFVLFKINSFLDDGTQIT